jgi:hypothetical protein
MAGKLGRRAVKTHGSSKFVGVHWDAPVGRWTATITLAGPPPRAVRIARFDREEDAAVAWDRVSIHLRGLTAPRNFPDRLLAPASIEEIRREARRLRKLRTESRWIGVQRVSSAKLAHSCARPWVCELRLPSGRLVSVAGYATEEEAALARDRLVLFYRGEGEELNFRAEALRLGPADPKTLQADREPRETVTMRRRFDGDVL